MRLQHRPEAVADESSWTTVCCNILRLFWDAHKFVVRANSRKALLVFAIVRTSLSWNTASPIYMDTDWQMKVTTREREHGSYAYGWWQTHHVPYKPASKNGASGILRSLLAIKKMSVFCSASTCIYYFYLRINWTRRSGAPTIDRCCVNLIGIIIVLDEDVFGESEMYQFEVAARDNVTMNSGNKPKSLQYININLLWTSIFLENWSFPFFYYGNP